MEKYKVSIIVPAYNVEKYIAKCIDSIQSQTYQNIEIVVVNDGSTDSTLSIIKNIASNDSRIIVSDISNSGVSSARNHGIDICNGDYIVFVDGDDYLACDFVEYMMFVVESTKAEFCISKNCYTKKNEEQTKSCKIATLSKEDATALLLSPEVIVGCWNKIYSKAFIEKWHLRFSTNLFYGEGLSFITTAAQLSNYVGVGNRKVYYYRRNNEASATSKFDIEKYINGEKSLYQIRSQLKIVSKKIETMFNLHMGLFCLGAVTRILSNKKYKVYKNEYLAWKKSLRHYTFLILSSKEVSFYRKAMLLVGSLYPSLLMKLDQKRRKKIASNSVE